MLAASAREIAEQMRAVGRRHRRRHRLPGRHARGPGDPRPQPGRRPRRQHGRHRRDRERRDRRHAGRQVQGQGAALRHPRPPARARSASGPRTSSGCWCAPASGELVRLGELIRIDQEPTLQAITRRDRERAITIFANVATGASQGDGGRPLAGDRALGPPGRLPRRDLGQHQGVPRVVPVAVVRLRPRPADRLHGAGLAVQLVLAPGGGPARAAVLDQRRARRAVARRPEPQRLQHARADPAGRHRQEELDHAGRLHEPDPRARRRAPRRRCSRPARSGCGRS